MRLPSFSGAPQARRFWPFAPLAGLLVLLHTAAPAQQPSNVVMRVPPQATAGSPLLISAELLYGETLEKVYLLYRTVERSDYTRLEMDLRGGSATILLPAADVLAPYLEYYLVLQRRDGILETHPLTQTDDPFGSPPANVLRIIVRPGDDGEPQVLMLSPDPLTPADPEELVVSASLLRTDSTIDRRATRLLVDGVDVTADAVLSGDVLVYVPANFGRTLAPGSHRVTLLLFAPDGALAGSITRPFIVAGVPGESLAEGDQFRYGLAAQVESRSERLADAQTWYNRGGLQFSGTYDIWSVRSSLFLTSDERADRQPQNRLFVSAAIPWFSLGYGDAYPNFSELVLNGKRVRGIHSSVTLGDFHVDLASGRTDREIEGRLLSVYGADTIGLVQQRDPGAAYAPIDQSTWGKYSYGTYARNLFAVRPWFGSSQDWRVGLTALSAGDDQGSIRFGVRPQENLVLGGDFVVRFMDNTLELGGQAAFSAYNSDISSGTFTDAYIDTTYPNNAASIKRVRDILDPFITVNDNLRPLSLSTPATLAWDGWIGVRAIDNELRFRYQYRGSDYTSFGQTFLRRDIEGFSLTDKIRLVGNRVFVTAGYERLQDNTTGTKIATTTYTSFTSAVSYYPGTGLPAVTIGYGHVDNDNGLPPDTVYSVDEVGDRFFLQSSYAFRAGAEHTASASFSTSARNDRTIRAFDVNDLAFTLGLSSRFTIPLTTSIDYALNRNDVPSAPGTQTRFQYSTLTFAARYMVAQDILMLRGSVSPTMGDLQRTILAGGLDWTLARPLVLMLDATYFYQDNIPDDAIWSMRLRCDL